jgi:hypothetical protein
MPRQNWKQGPEHIQENVRRWLGTIPAVDVVRRTLFELGYDMTVDEIPTDDTTSEATKLWKGRRTWAATTSIEDDPAFKQYQQSQAADAERARITTERFIDGLTGSVCQFLDAEWNRANAKWQAEHPRNADHTHAPEVPAFTDIMDTVLSRLGYRKES